jgi:hypothetical protein
LLCHHRFREGIESHAVIIGSYKPYQRPGYPHPSEVTHKLRAQLIRIQQNNFRHSTIAQAEQSGPSNRNTHTFKKQKLAEEAEEEALEEQQALARAVSTRQYAIVQKAGSVTGRARTT